MGENAGGVGPGAVTLAFASSPAAEALRDEIRLHLSVVSAMGPTEEDAGQVRPVLAPPPPYCCPYPCPYCTLPLLTTAKPLSYRGGGGGGQGGGGRCHTPTRRHAPAP